MINNERPGVYSSIEVLNPLRGMGQGRTIGIAAAANSGEKGVCTKISTYAEAVGLFGTDCNITELIRLLFLNGAYVIEAVPASVDEIPTVPDYEAAFDLLMKKENVSVMICDSSVPAVHEAMRLAILGATENYKYRVGVVETGGSVAAAAAKAEAINCERMVMLYPAAQGVDFVCGAAAAAFAGMLASGGDPALPVNGSELKGLAGFSRTYSDEEITSLVKAGITPVESFGGKVSVVRGVTTRTQTAGEPDATWRELTTILIVDNVIPSVRSALKIKFPRVKNTSQTRGAIRTQVIIELENKLRQEIIEDYGSVSARAHEDDPTVCVVSFNFAVAHGLNRIYLTAHISV